MFLVSAAHSMVIWLEQQLTNYSTLAPAAHHSLLLLGPTTHQACSNSTLNVCLDQFGPSARNPFASILFSHSEHLFPLNSDFSGDQSPTLSQIEAVLSTRKVQ